MDFIWSVGAFFVFSGALLLTVLVFYLFRGSWRFTIYGVRLIYVLNLYLCCINDASIIKIIHTQLKLENYE
ncbi:hypothetical protein AsAng_0036670 [Aureispira anguillae]|uniref:Uncharacterized protein n=1 Tax=Aureispira anguillae TaxID=2864201 RepID=A0A916DUR3_9BACT|nr:hypothetical protein AsAng_0036670 [Aureispira anguillae]